MPLYFESNDLFSRPRSTNRIGQSISDTAILRMLILKLNKRTKHNLNSINLYKTIQ